MLAAEAADLATAANIQVHGALAFTWEHDAHLLLKRASGVAAPGLIVPGRVDGTAEVLSSR